VSRQSRRKSQTGYYHIMCRGNERRNIFSDNQDKLRFVDTLLEKKQEVGFRLQAFCLMDNHFHLMISEGTEDIARTMKRITVSYVYYFNHKYERVGHLFQDRFKSEVVEQDDYVLALVRYIHQNPVKAGMVESVDDYQWSSYHSYFTDGMFGRLIDTGTVLRLFAKNMEVAKELYKQYMNGPTELEFIDLPDKMNQSGAETLTALFEQLLKEQGIAPGDYDKDKISENFIREFKQKTNLSLRQIALVTGLNKDKIHKIIHR
jgi:putative transposase